LEWTLIGGCSGSHNPDVEEDTEHGEGDDDACNRCVDRPHVSRNAAGEEKEGDLKHEGETFDEETERPSLETIGFALAITTPFDRRSSTVSEVPVEPLLAQHCDECS